MTVVVTGGAGLVGGHVIAALVRRGAHVRALVHPRGRQAVERLGAEATLGDVTDPAAWRRVCEGSGGVEGIVHAAALVARRATLSEYLRVNVRGTELAAAAARAAGARLIHVSSVAVYGRRRQYQHGPGTVDEHYPWQRLDATDFYARSKRLAETRLWEETARGGLWAVALRPNVVYGEFDHRFSRRVVRLVRTGFVPQIGPGHNHLSVVYAGNVAAAAVAALDAPLPGGAAYNVTNDGALTQREFADTFAVALGVRLRRIRLPAAPAAGALRAYTLLRRLVRPGSYVGVAAGSVHFLGGDNPYCSDRARHELGWNPPTDPHTAIRRTARWCVDSETPGG